MFDNYPKYRVRESGDNGVWWLEVKDRFWRGWEICAEGDQETMFDSFYTVTSRKTYTATDLWQRRYFQLRASLDHRNTR